MADVNDLFIRIFTDGSQLEPGLNAAQGKLDIFEEGVKKLGKQMMEVFSVIAIEEFIRGCVDAADEAARATAKVSQALKNTGDASGQSLEEIKKTAEELQSTSLFRGDTILTEVSSQLLTFSNIGVESFKRAETAALDMATAIGDGEGLQGMARLLGKALQDPIAGLNLLQRQLRIFTPDQRELIKNFMETNDIVGAQNVILSVVEGRYGGQAKAAADASNGITMFKNAIYETNGEIGTMIEKSTGLANVLKFVAEAYKFSFAPSKDATNEDYQIEQWKKTWEDEQGYKFGTLPPNSDSGTKDDTEKQETTYADLTAKLKAYQEEFNDSTIETRAGIAQKIADIKAEIEEWNNAGKAIINYTGTIKGLENELTTMQTAKEAMPTNDPMAIAKQTDLINQKQNELNVLKNASVAWVEYGDSLKTTINGRVVTGIDEMCTAWDRYKSKTNDTLADVAASVQRGEKAITDIQAKEAARRKALGEAINATYAADVNQMIASVASSLGTLIGDLVNGNEDAGDAALKIFGKLIGEVGEMAITLGVLIMDLQASLANPFGISPGLLIGAGIAAVAMGEVMTNASKSSSESFGSGTSSTSNTFDTRGAQANLYQNQTIELVQRGRDMVASIKLNQLYYNRQG